MPLPCPPKRIVYTHGVHGIGQPFVCRTGRRARPCPDRGSVLLFNSCATSSICVSISTSLYPLSIQRLLFVVSSQYVSTSFRFQASNSTRIVSIFGTTKLALVTWSPRALCACYMQLVEIWSRQQHQLAILHACLLKVMASSQVGIAHGLAEVCHLIQSHDCIAL